MGRLTKNTNGQPMVSVSSPPIAGPDEARQPEHGAEQALVPAALGRREQVGDRGHRDREHRARRPGPGRRARATSSHISRDRPGQERARHEHADPEQEHRPAAEQVGQLAVQRAADRRGQQVGGEGPGVEAVAAEVRDDPRQRRADDGLVEGREEDTDHDRAEDAHADGVGEHDRRAIRRSDPCLHGGHLCMLLSSVGDTRSLAVIRSTSFLITC